MSSISAISCTTSFEAYEAVRFLKNYEIDRMISKTEKIQFIQALADHVSSKYATYFTSEWAKRRAEYIMKTRSKDFDDLDYPKKFPSKESLENFQLNLKNKIVKLLNKEDHYNYINLSTKDASLLGQVLNESNINWRDYPLNKFLPGDTHFEISITINEKKAHLCVVSNFIDSKTINIISNLWANFVQPPAFVPKNSPASSCARKIKIVGISVLIGVIAIGMKSIYHALQNNS